TSASSRSSTRSRIVTATRSRTTASCCTCVRNRAELSRERNLSRAPADHLLRVRARELGDFDAAEHPGKLFDSLLARQTPHGRAARLAVRQLRDAIVMTPLARDLGQMRHA